MMRTMYSGLATAVSAVALAFSGCRTTRDILNDYERDLSSGAYEHATVEVGKLAAEGGGDGLFWQLHAANAHHLTANTGESVRRFDLAEDVFLENDQESVFSKSVGGTYAMMTNDKAFPYAGGGQDRIFTCLYKAMDYGASGNIAAMRTELNRAAQHQENWLHERRKDIDAAQERLRKDAEAYRKENAKVAMTSGTNDSTAVDNAMLDAGLAARFKDALSFDPAADGRLETLSTKDYMNVYVQTVCGLFRWLSGESDGKYFLRDAAALKPGYAQLAQDSADANGGICPKDSIWVFVEDGLCQRRKEWRIDLPTILIPGLNRYVLYAGMAFPQLEMRPAANAGYAVQANGATIPLVELESVDRLLKTEYDVYMRGAMTREVTRTIVKTGLQIALGVAAEHVNDNATRWALIGSQYAAAAWAASMTGADIRSWTGLPKTVYACRVPRPTNGQLTLKASNGQTTTVSVAPGNSLVFLRQPAASATPVVKIVTLP